MPDGVPNKKEIFNLVEAQAESIDSISKRLVSIEQLIEKQEDRNKNIVYAVLLASVLILVTVAAEVILSDHKDAQFYSGLRGEIYDQNLKIQDLINQFTNLKVRNSYLK